MTFNINRRKYFIDKRFQRRFMMQFCFIVVMAGLLLAAGILYFSKDSSIVTVAKTKVTVQQAADFFLPVMSSMLLIVLIISSLAALALTLLTSHKIVGPLWRLSREIGNLGNGDFRRNFHIRDNDQLQQLAVGLDDMCRNLKEKHRNLKDTFEALKGFMAAKNFCLAHKDSDDCIGMLKDVQSSLDEFKL